MDWSKYYTLKDGESRRCTHDCGTDRSASIMRVDNKLIFKCFRCGTASIHTPTITLKQRLADIKAKCMADKRILRLSAGSLPLPATSLLDAPKEAQEWLLRGGMSLIDATAYGIYYHDPSHRVVIPIYDQQTSALVYYQARGFSDDAPKYLNPKVDKRSFIATYGKGDVIVLTEDLLSMFAVSKCTQAISLLGTSLYRNIQAYLATISKPVLIWLDPDKAGLTGAGKAYTILSNIGVQCAIVHSEKDPKLYNSGDIYDIIQHSIATSFQGQGYVHGTSAIHQAVRARCPYAYDIK